MSLKKVKKIIAQFLVVSLLIPKLNVQALDKTYSSQEKTSTQVETIKENSKDEAKTDLEGEGSLNSGNESEEYEENQENDSENQNVKDETLTEENTDISDSNNTDEVEVEDESSKETKTETKTEEKVNDNSKEEVSAEANPKKGTVYNKRKVTKNNVSFFTAQAKSSELDEELSELDEELKEFAMLKKEAVEEIEFLEPLTDKEYELTVANEDGSYEFVDAYDDYNEAVNNANALRTTAANTDQVPAVINYSGAVVYSTNQMGRLVIARNNQITYAGTVNLYTDSSLKNAFTYLNVSSIEDVPVLETTSTAAKVMVNGYVGWIPNNVGSGNYNLIYTPLSTASNPSYYTVTNGELVHFLSYNLVGTTGFKLVLGKAPSYLKEGVKYLSYDGKYFYEYNSSNLSSKLNTLINDYKAGVRSNAINASNPFYLYYQNLPFRSKTVYTAAELDNFINNKTSSNSKLRGLGQALKNAEANYGVNAVLILAVAINESGFGTSNIALTKNNLFGMAAYDSNTDAAISYATPGDSVIDFAKNFISAGYSDPADWRYYGGFLGNKNRGANVKYASDPFWGEKAAQHAYSVDKYLSGGSSNLRDANSKQIGIATTNNSVITTSGSELYPVSNNLNNYAFYTETPFVISNFLTTTIGGKSCYEIIPEITNPLFTNGNLNNFTGNYNWNQKAYISTSGVKLVNTFVPQVEVKYGINRFETAVKLSQGQFKSAETIVIANGYAIIDGVSATPLAAKLKSPLLLTETNSIPNSVKNEIKRLGAKSAIIVGGSGVVTSNVEKELNALGITKITRLGGSTRFDTSLQVAKYIDQNLYDVENIVVAAGIGEADALSISPVAGNQNMPILLVDKDRIHSQVFDWMKSESLNNAYIIGGTGVVSDSVLNTINGITKQDIRNNRLGGLTRYETNAKVIERFYGSVVDKAYITVGDPLADSLTAGVVAGINNSPVILAKSELVDAQKSVLQSKTTNKIVQVGGTVSSKAVQNLKELLSRTQ